MQRSWRLPDPWISWLIGPAVALAGALFLVWLFGVKQEMLEQKPPHPPNPVEVPASGPASLPTDYRGDLIGYARTSTALQAVRSENRLALLTLANATIILHERSLPMGGEIPYVTAFESLNEDPAALLAFRELVLNAAPPGQIYGLCGLFLKRSAAFQPARAYLVQSPRALVWFRSSDDVLEQMSVRQIAEKPELVCRTLGKGYGHE